MKCNQCGTEFEGKFCPECGAKNEVETPVTPPPVQQQTQQQVYQQPAPAANKPKKKKKPFFLRWWFILLAIIVVGVIALSVGGGGEKIVWDDIILGDMLPEPPANKGEIHTNAADELWIDINNLSDKQFNDYVAACKEKGFNVDFDKGEDYYYADNSEGWHISVRYEGNNIMSIDIDAPSEDDDTSTTTPSTDSSPETSKPDTTEKDDSDNSAIDPDFKAAMDSYEKFMDEYVAFMKKYSANPTDMGLLADYADYMSKYADFVEDFEKWEDEEMNAAETAYYIDVQARVSKKLLEVAQ